jgi:hypothetical protein
MKENKNRRIPSGFIFKDQKVGLFFDIIDPETKKEISDFRLNICNQCEHLRSDKVACRLCGCSLSRKVSMIYPFDDDGKAFNNISLNGERNYVCPIKKW